jgi:hypothetical protein
MSRFPHFLDDLLTDGAEVVSLVHWLHLYPQEDSSFLLEDIDLRAIVWLEGFGQLKTPGHWELNP